MFGFAFLVVVFLLLVSHQCCAVPLLVIMHQLAQTLASFGFVQSGLKEHFLAADIITEETSLVEARLKTKTTQVHTQNTKRALLDVARYPEKKGQSCQPWSWQLPHWLGLNLTALAPIRATRVHTFLWAEFIHFSL